MADVLVHARRAGRRVVEVRPEAEQRWDDAVEADPLWIDRVAADFQGVQDGDGRSVVTPVSGRILAGPGRATRRFGDAWSQLRGRRPVHTVVVDEFCLRFGR